MSNSAKLNESTAAMLSLQTEKAEADAKISDCQKELADAKAELDSVLAEPKTAANIQYLRAAKGAWEASIKAFEASIATYQNDTDAYSSEIEAILKRNPEARTDTP